MAGIRTKKRMAYKEKEIEKLYYSIGEVAEQFNVAPSLIRFWETEFDILQPKKNRKGSIAAFTAAKVFENALARNYEERRRLFVVKGTKRLIILT